MQTKDERWPALPLDEWRETAETLHLWTQIVGKIRLVRMPWINHSWHVPLYVSARGLTTSRIPTPDGAFEITFDFVDHLLEIRTDAGERRALPLQRQTVADFYAALMNELRALDLATDINPVPNEIESPIPFPEDRRHGTYDPEYAHRFWRVLLEVERVFERFRASFLGKNSPIHFFWGSFDLAVTRFSGRPAPQHPGGIPNLPDWVAREAYSHEVSSAGFWPGGGPHPYPLFYSYAYPEPPGFPDAAVQPEGAFFSQELREFVLPYEVVRAAAKPDELLMDFLVTTYEAAAELGGWDRAALERHEDPRVRAVEERRSGAAVRRGRS